MTNKSRRNYLIAIALILSLSGLSACSGKSKPVIEQSESATNSSPTASESSSPQTSPIAAFVAPLTGLPVEQTVNNRPFAVLINNLAPARPQSGMTQADVVWELQAEGGITRFVVVFQSKQFTDPIGPIRSIRPYFLEVGEFYNSVLVHAGASNDALAILQKQKKQTLDEINNAGAYFYRDKSRKAPHNVYSTLEKLSAAVEKRQYTKDVTVPQMLFDSAPSELITAPTATKINLKFLLSDYKVSYEYDAAKGKYLRSINDKPHIDKNNDEQLSATNLVVLSAKHTVYDDVGRLDIDLNSGGEAVLFQQGKVIQARWERKAGDVIRLMKDGKELPFLPGVTYYHVVSNAKAMDTHLTYE
ncbi:MAG: DUF3048 domain-containing protein [Candidatus Cohnella colombiensis]|uniref:DUF3048 domain-containing protein n=1 Tax=Candidatus Cohnella colombiensis TaxID=3121368 RepID=A0AA95EUC4_9BACL|nr:MAG: DUF3048 domain-containing protein [Cohnella sp.]